MYLYYTEYTKGGKNMFCDIYLNDFYNIMEDTKGSNKDLEKYTRKEITNFKGGKVIIAYDEENILNFINVSKKTSNEKLYYGKINNTLALKIYGSINLYLKYYNFSLQRNSLKHIFNHHGTYTRENKRGQIKILAEDFILLPEILTNYDRIYLSHKVECNNISFVIEKEINNIIYKLICYVSNKKHTIEVKTLYKIKRTLPLCI